MDDKTGLLERAIAATGRVVRQRGGPDDAPTPCPDWDVRGLINHLVAGNIYFGLQAKGEEADFALFSADHLGDNDPADVYDASAKSALEAWRTPGATDRFAAMPSGDPGPRLCDIHLLESYMHGWDLATATGQDRTLDPEVTQALYDSWYGKMPPEVRALGNVFGPEVECPPDAPIGDRLAAYYGRTP